MDINCVYIKWTLSVSVLLLIVDGFTVKGPSGPLVAPLGSSVVLPCYVDELLLMEGLEVEWRRTDSGILVHIFLDGESRPEVPQNDYQDRAHLFTDQIQHGNFSLRLDNLRAEDEGRYTCTVHTQQDSGETVVKIKDIVSDEFISASVGENITHMDSRIPPEGNFSLRLQSVGSEDKGVYMCQVFAGGFSASATAKLERLVLVFCFAAASGAVLLLCCLLYCRSKNTVTSTIIRNLQLSLAFCPNICMFCAFIFWGFTEGFLIDTIISSAFTISRSFMLTWTYLNNQDKSWIRFSSRKRELAVFTVVVYSVFLIDAWKKSTHDKTSARRILFGMFYGFVVLLSFVVSRGFIRMHVKWSWLYFLSLAQIFQLISSFGLPNSAFLAVPMVQTILLMCMRTPFWKLAITLYIILVVYVHGHIFEKEKEYLMWTCMVLFLEVLRIIVAFEDRDYITEAEHSEVQRQQTEMRQQVLNASPPFYEIMFGAVGLVLLNSGILTSELILKTRNGEQVVKDLRLIVFISECVFALYWLFLQICAFLKIKPGFIFK